MLPPEVEEGNIEYKRSLLELDKDIDKRRKLSTQMNWRLNEGLNMKGIPEAIYYIGINDNGTIGGQSVTNIERSLVELEQAIEVCKATIVSTVMEHTSEGVYCKVIIRRHERVNQVEEVKVGFWGPAGSGKTTLVSVLTHGELDNGDGSARQSVLRYDHELESGETSSIIHEILGFSNNSTINYTNGTLVDPWKYIVRNSNKIVNIIDLPGSTKYFRTTLFGIQSYRPDLMILVKSVQDETNAQFQNMIDICKKLEIPIKVVCTKTDLSSYKPAHNEIAVSNVTGNNIEVLTNVLRTTVSRSIVSNNPKTMFLINEVMYIPEIGTVVMGTVVNGNITCTDRRLMVGPIGTGFYRVYVQSIHYKQMACKTLHQGETGSLVVKSDISRITKGMCIMDPNHIKHFHKECCLYLPDLPNNINEFTMFINNVIENVAVTQRDGDFVKVKINKDNEIRLIKTGDPVIARKCDWIGVGTVSGIR